MVANSEILWRKYFRHIDVPLVASPTMRLSREVSFSISKIYHWKYQLLIPLSRVLSEAGGIRKKVDLVLCGFNTLRYAT